MQAKSTVDITKGYVTKIMADVEFLFRIKNNYEIRVKAYKADLSSRSTVFGRMFCVNLLLKIY